MHYTIRSSPVPPKLDPDWDDPIWSRADTLEVTHFRPESSYHRPRTLAQLLYTAQGIHGLFQVHDRYVRCLHTGYLGEVWKDSCVEFFAQPKPDRGYFNLEFNCGGAFLCSHIINPERTPDGFKEFTKVPAAFGHTIQVRLLPAAASRAREHRTRASGPCAFYIPFALFEHYVGPLGEPGPGVARQLPQVRRRLLPPALGLVVAAGRIQFSSPDCFGTIHFA